MISERRNYVIVLKTAFLCGIYTLYVFDLNLVEKLAYEDGIVETFGAIMFLVASFGFGLVFLRSMNQVDMSKDQARGSGGIKRNILSLLLSLFFLVCFMEEISWGQRIFDIETPAAMKKVNRQGEINIHNLKWFHGKDESGKRKPFWQLLINGDRLFSMFWFGYGVCIPLIVKFSCRMKELLAKIRLPLVPMQYVFLLMLNYLISMVLGMTYPEYRHGFVETKETIIAFLFACVALGLAFHMFKQQEEALANTSNEIDIAS
jgi:hypothetical protein